MKHFTHFFHTLLIVAVFGLTVWSAAYTKPGYLDPGWILFLGALLVFVLLLNYPRNNP